MSSYSHTQRGMIHWIVYVCGIGIFALAFGLNGGAVYTWSMATSGAFCVFLGMCFHYLRVTDCGDSLEVRFGPVALFGTSIAYSEISSVTVARTRLIDGLGVHWSPGHGWTYNISGRDCVEINRTSGSRVRVGTDDAPRLAGVIGERLRSSEESDARGA